MNAPEIISAEMISPFSEIMILALVAASAISSSSARVALRNIVSTAFEEPSGFSFGRGAVASSGPASSGMPSTTGSLPAAGPFAVFRAIALPLSLVHEGSTTQTRRYSMKPGVSACARQNTAGDGRARLASKRSLPRRLARESLRPKRATQSA